MALPTSRQPGNCLAVSEFNLQPPRFLRVATTTIQNSVSREVGKLFSSWERKRHIPEMGFTRPLFAALGIFAGTAVATTESSSAAAIHDLSLLKWTVTNEYGNITVPGKFPSQAHLDLHAAGVIGKSRKHSNSTHMMLFTMLTSKPQMNREDHSLMIITVSIQGARLMRIITETPA